MRYSLWSTPKLLGRSIQFTRSINKRPPMQKLQADCVAGTFAKYAQTRLGYPSFIEASVRSARAAEDHAEHGMPSQRDHYTRYGHANDLATCLNPI